MTALDTRALADEFAILWDAYPNATQRPKAHLAFLVARKGGATLQEMLDALAWQTQQPKWLDSGGRYVPKLENWLTNQQWLDRPPQVPVVKERTARTLAAVAAFARRTG